MWKLPGFFHSLEARRTPSAPTIPVISVPGSNSCILSVSPAMSAAVLPAVAVIPQASARLDRLPPVPCTQVRLAGRLRSERNLAEPRGLAIAA